MITLIGEETSPEYKVAQDIYGQVVNTIPAIISSPESIASIQIASGVKLSGYKVSDIDIVVAGYFKKPWAFIPSFALTSTTDEIVKGKQVQVKNFVIAIEVKDHDHNSIKITGEKVKVRYSRRGVSEWKSATDQNIEQMHAIRDYFRLISKRNIYTYRTLVLTGLDRSPVKGALPGNFTFKEMLTQMLATTRVQKTYSGEYLIASVSSGVWEILKAPVFNLIRPAGLDRKRMDAIITENPLVKEVASLVGSRFIHVRGHGGTGKTILLLALAHKMIKEMDVRVLFLTYNHALAADITRLLSLFSNNSFFSGASVRVTTAVGFLSDWIKMLGVSDVVGINEYDRFCSECIDLFRHGGITQKDVSDIKVSNDHALEYDLVFVDEAQDWPQQEIDLLQQVYNPEQMVIANGLEQMLRSQTKANWDKHLSTSERKTFYLDTSLRMKRNLGIFTNSFAEAVGVDWSVEPNDRAGGGGVIFVRKGNPKLRNIHQKLLASAKENGNSEIDILHCVPTSYITISKDHRKTSAVATSLIKDKIKVWDAVDDAVRRDIPRDPSMVRVVHYNSCRGLEGWTVFLHSIDEYFSEKNMFLGSGRGVNIFSEESQLSAFLTLMIPLTRAIDTLVVTYEDDKSPVLKAMKSLSNKFRDFIEVVG